MKSARHSVSLNEGMAVESEILAVLEKLPRWRRGEYLRRLLIEGYRTSSVGSPVVRMGPVAAALEERGGQVDEVARAAPPVEESFVPEGGMFGGGEQGDGTPFSGLREFLQFDK